MSAARGFMCLSVAALANETEGATNSREKTVMITGARAMTTHPAEVQAAWTRGWALDVHTTSSQFLGYNDQGHPQFDTIRSPLGELVYQLKYGGQRKAVEVAAVMSAFFDNKPNALAKIDLVVPMPASTARAVQPVVEVAEALAK
jgi:competence protein ComFC